MALTFGTFLRTNDAARYLFSSNVTDTRAWIESVCGPGSTSLMGATILNPIAAVWDGDWIIPTSTGFVVLTNAQFTAGYTSMPTVQLENALGMGSVVGTLGIGGTQTLDIDIHPALPDITYGVQALGVNGINLLATLTITSTTIIDSNTVRVGVRNDGLVSLTGGKVVVMAVDQ